MIATALLLAALLPLAPLVFGSGFQSTVGYGEILVPGAAAAGLISVMSPVLVGHGNARSVTRIGLAGLGASIWLYAALIPTLHAWGAAIASTVAYLSIAGCYAWAVARLGVVGRLSDWAPSRAELEDYRGLGRAVRGLPPLRRS